MIKKLEDVVGNNIPHINLKFAFFNNHKIRSYFKHKDSLPAAMRSLVVYSFTCAKCSLAYLGSTKKMFSLRVNEHRGISSRTGRPLQTPTFSSVREHCLNTCNIPFSIKDFKILSYCHTETELRVTESLLIKMKKPSLNIDTSCASLKIL